MGKSIPAEVKDADMKPAVEEETLLIDKIIKDVLYPAPSRYAEAGLVKAPEEKGMRRPSTYAAIILPSP